MARSVAKLLYWPVAAVGLIILIILGSIAAIVLAVSAVARWISLYAIYNGDASERDKAEWRAG
jgi:hypothetical protein